MRFTDLFIRRPVLASVVSLLILLLGLRAITALDLRQYPKTENTVVTITTTYPGASSELIKGFITTPLQQAIAEADGIDYLSSVSRQGVSIIEAHMRLNYSANAAVAEIQAKVASQRNVLPTDTEDPVITAQVGDTTALMYLALYSDSLQAAQISDYLLRVVQPKLQAVPGVGKAKMLGNKVFAMRVWLEPERLNALGITAADVNQVLRANNYLSGAGGTKGEFVRTDISATTDATDLEGFRKLIVANRHGQLIRLEDIARTELGSEDYDTVNWYKGKLAIFVGIEPAPGANPLTVAKLVKQSIHSLQEEIPDSMQVFIPYDASQFIEDSIHEVFTTLLEAVLIVLAVIFLSLGSFRAALIPAVTVPLSLIGGAFLMLLMGFTINVLTMLAMVLAIGLVVDDAIVMVENIHRHIEQGESRLHAALLGARELGLPIIAMTTTLIAVYAPIGFMGGLVGTLFTEFAFSLAGSVLISGVVALTLSPMMSSRLLPDRHQPNRFEQWLEHAFAKLANRYVRSLDYILAVPMAVIGFAAIVLVSLYFMFMLTSRELAPTEDQSILFAIANGPQTATLNYNETYARQLVSIFESIPEYKESFVLMGFAGDTSTVFSGFKMPSTQFRLRSQNELQPELQAKVNNIAGFQTAVVPRPSLPGSGGGLPLQFVITADADYQQLDQVGDQLSAAAMASGKFAFLMKDVNFNRPKSKLLIDRNRAADLGISMEDVGKNLAALLGGQYVNRFSLQGRSYKVIPQVADDDRLDISKLDQYYLRSASGEQVLLSSLVKVENSVEPSKRTQFQQLNSLTINALMIPGVGLGDAMAFLEQQAHDTFPRGFSWDFTGESRQYAQQGSALLITFFMALLIIYLVLAAQFESWRDH